MRSVITALTVLTLLFAVYQAASWYGRPYAGAFIDHNAVVSNFGLSEEVEELGLGFPDRVSSIDGRRLASANGRVQSEVWDAAIQQAAREGRSSVQVELAPEGARSASVELPIYRIGAGTWWTYAGSLMFSGALFLAAGLVALTIGGGSALAVAFAKVGLSTGLLCLTTFDFHTTRRLLPVFFLAFAMFPIAWVFLALRLPDDVAALKRWPWLEHVAEALGLAMGVAFIWGFASGRSTLGLQAAWSGLMAAAFVFFGVTFLARFVRSVDLRRRRMRALLVSVVPPLLVILGALFTKSLVLGPLAKSLSYAALSLFPLATAYALIRYDLWGTRALLSRLLTRAAAVALVAGVAVAIGTATAVELGAAFGHALLAAALTAAVCSVSVAMALGAVDRYFFTARARYKPTVAQLGEELISITSPDDVARAVERTIRRWLPCDDVRVTLAPTESPRAESGVRPAARSEDTGRPQGAGGVQQAKGAEDAQGVHGAIPATDAGTPMNLDLAFGGDRLGWLRVGPKRDEALFTEDDLDLLQTIVNQGALALAHAFAYQELETRRQEQAAAWRGERAALVETVAAEIAHEIRYPINFFRAFFRTQGEAPVDAEDLDIGREEVDRLERLVAGLRRMASGSLDRRPVALEQLCNRTETLLRDALGDRAIDRKGLESVTVSADVDQLTQILVNLTSNGLQATGKSGKVGITWKGGAAPCLVIWDDGPGFEGSPTELFAPWYTTKQKGTGLGLAITHRLVRAHGWGITAARDGGRTEFRVMIDPDDVLETSSAGTTPSSRPGEDSDRRRSA